jgi:hypothetical protein
MAYALGGQLCCDLRQVRLTQLKVSAGDPRAGRLRGNGLGYSLNWEVPQRVSRTVGE